MQNHGILTIYRLTDILKITVALFLLSENMWVYGLVLNLACKIIGLSNYMSIKNSSGQNGLGPILSSTMVKSKTKDKQLDRFSRTKISGLSV